MKKSELRKIIKEEIQKLNEARNVFHTKSFIWIGGSENISDFLKNPKDYVRGDVEGKELSRLIRKATQWKNAGFKIIKKERGSKGGDISASLF